MTLGLCFWIIMLVWIVFFGAVHFGMIGGVYGATGNTLLLIILFVLLGWQTFGPPLHK